MIRHQHLTISIKDLAPKVSLTSHGAGAILRETKSATVSRRQTLGLLGCYGFTKG